MWLIKKVTPILSTVTLAWAGHFVNIEYHYRYRVKGRGRGVIHGFRYFQHVLHNRALPKAAVTLRYV